jgi:hypothetical protein
VRVRGRAHVLNGLGRAETRACGPPAGTEIIFKNIPQVIITNSTLGLANSSLHLYNTSLSLWTSALGLDNSQVILHAGSTLEVRPARGLAAATAGIWEALASTGFCAVLVGCALRCSITQVLVLRADAHSVRVLRLRGPPRAPPLLPVYMSLRATRCTAIPLRRATPT